MKQVNWVSWKVMNGKYSVDDGSMPDYLVSKYEEEFKKEAEETLKLKHLQEVVYAVEQYNTSGQLSCVYFYKHESDYDPDFFINLSTHCLRVLRVK